MSTTNLTDVIAAVKAQADLVQVISETISLTKAGSNFKGLCPFHQEKTPSFVVNPTKGNYHCFGCGASGSVIDFVMHTQRLEFSPALQQLAEKMGITYGHGQVSERGGNSLDALQAAQQFYHGLLMGTDGKAARQYLTQRGFGKKDCQAFHLGWSPEAWQTLVNHCNRTKTEYTEKDLLTAGLVKKSPSGRLYDAMRNRILFPIITQRERCCGFGGRALDDENPPKYLNTAETVHYKKNRQFYGEAQAKDAIYSKREALLVEGYFDVIRLHQHGFAHALGTCGTSLTAEHIAQLKRMVDRVWLVFDGDKAGLQAALRAVPLFLSEGLEARVVVLPNGLDPDDFLRRYEAAAFSEHLQQAQSLIVYATELIAREAGPTMEGRQTAIQRLLPMLSEITNLTARDLAIQLVADSFSITPATLLGELSKQQATAARRSNPSIGQPQPAPPPELNVHSPRETQLLQWVLTNPALLEVATECVLQAADFTNPELAALYQQIETLPVETLVEAVKNDDVASHFPEKLRTIIVQLLSEINAQDGHMPHLFQALTNDQIDPMGEPWHQWIEPDARPKAMQTAIYLLKQQRYERFWQEAEKQIKAGTIDPTEANAEAMALSAHLRALRSRGPFFSNPH